MELITEHLDSVPAGYFTLTLEGDPSLDLTDLKGIGPKTDQRLVDREITDQAELLLTVPRKYRRIFRFHEGPNLVRARAGYVELVGRVRHVDNPGAHSRRPFQVLVDVDGQKFKLLWFNIPYPGFDDQFRPGRWAHFEGEVDWERGEPSLAHPTVDVSSDRPAERPPRTDLEPVYTSMEGIPDAKFRSAIEQAADHLLDRTRDIIPQRLLQRRELGTVRSALSTIHLLQNFDDVETFEQELTRARQRLVYEEFFTLQKKLAEEYASERRGAEAPVCEDRHLGRSLVRELAFELTDDQKKASATLADELARRRPMRRLLQGDVGSGKTVVAMAAAAICIDNGRQVAMMAPTDILARQHLRRARTLFEDFDVEVALLVGSMTDTEKADVIETLSAGEADLVIGTHALFQDEVDFDRLGFVIVDEQHKFGVDQRASLLDKGRDPHLLAMTATPIPRSLAHSAFGDLDLTLIREKPPGRKPVRTFLRDRTAAGDVYEYVRDRLGDGAERAFFVYPMVEPSDNAPNRPSVLESAQRLANGPFQPLDVAVLHGRMDDTTKDRTMQQFADGDIDVLCATTVVEVGMDVEEATLMVIEGPENFGLSQLHQLRGRVGRGRRQSMCIMLAGYGLTPEARERLQSFASTEDGFVLAEKDLELRGPGEFLGERQSGRAEFRYGDLLDDRELLED
ncbi:MAG: ATP-dependent DNA helicase RecG, partial [Bradymonadaceae bacterium]